jgi:hypothetical protein
MNSPLNNRKRFLTLSDRKRITSVELVNGFPTTHPFTLIANLHDIVVVAITPAILVLTISIISSNCSSVKSGAILSKMGFCFGFAKFLFCIV